MATVSFMLFPAKHYHRSLFRKLRQSDAYNKVTIYTKMADPISTNISDSSLNNVVQGKNELITELIMASHFVISLFIMFILQIYFDCMVYVSVLLEHVDY